MPAPTRTLETDPRWLAAATDEIAASGHVVFEPLPFLRDAKAAHQLLYLVVLSACLLDRIAEDPDVDPSLQIDAAGLRQAMSPWIPLPEAQAPSISLNAWIGRVVAIQREVFGVSLPPEAPSSVTILNNALVEVETERDALARYLRLAQADADHLRVLLENEKREAAVDLEHMRSATATMRWGADGVRLLGSLLDRARNWVQDPELRAEIEKHCPPTPRTEADRG